MARPLSADEKQVAMGAAGGGMAEFLFGDVGGGGMGEGKTCSAAQVCCHILSILPLLHPSVMC